MDISASIKDMDMLKEEEDLPNSNFETDITKIYIIAAIYLACSIAAALLVAFFVDPLSRFESTDERRDRSPSTGLQLLVATFRQMMKKEQILVIPITFWSGIEQGFFGADFTAVSTIQRKSMDRCVGLTWIIFRAL